MNGTLFNNYYGILLNTYTSIISTNNNLNIMNRQNPDLNCRANFVIREKFAEGETGLDYFSENYVNYLKSIAFAYLSSEKNYTLTINDLLISPKISIVSQPQKIEFLVPDLSDDKILNEIGMDKIKGEWYSPNKASFPRTLTKDDVIIIYGRDKEGKPNDIGICSKKEFSKIYTNSEKYEQGNIEFINPDNIEKGKISDAIKCSSCEVCLLPVGTKLSTKEGIVTVKPGQVVIINEAKNSIYASNIDKFLKIYRDDPLNPASKEFINLLQEYLEKLNSADFSIQDAIYCHKKILYMFYTINRSKKLCEILDDSQNLPTDLKGEYKLAAKIAKKMDEKYLSQIDVTDFDRAIEQARHILIKINQDKNLTEIQKNVAKNAVMVKLLPKTNLHQHLKGSVPKDITIELAKDKKMTQGEISKIETSYSKGEAGYENLHDFNISYANIGVPIKTPDDYHKAIKGIVKEAMKQGQLAVEIRCACDSIKNNEGKDLSPEEGSESIIKSIRNIRKEIKKEGLEPPKLSFVFLSYRGRDWDKSIESARIQAKEAVKAAVKYPDMKFGFDIAGPEDTGYGPKAFKDAINIIKEYNQKVENGEIQGEKIGITMHAGETPTFDRGREGYLSVEEAVEMGVDRIGHGVQAVLNPNTMKKLKKSGITVEICGVCNVLSIPLNTKGFEKHPIDEFIKNDIPVAICTDNDAICATNITKEYLQFLLTGHSNFMDWNNVKQSIRAGINAAFISEKDKKELFSILEYRVNKIQDLLNEVNGTDNTKNIKYATL